MKSDFTYPAVGVAISPRHIPPSESECERIVRIERASLRIATAYSISLRRARLMVRHSSVRVRA